MLAKIFLTIFLLCAVSTALLALSVRNERVYVWIGGGFVAALFSLLVTILALVWGV